MFIDSTKIKVKAGDGGKGCRAFRREAGVPRGGPSGGDGGHGGNVMVRGDRNIHTLLDMHFHKHYRAGHGVPGKGKDMTGKCGQDCVIPLPLGTLVLDEQRRVLCDVTQHGQIEIIARGGRGGKGNARFATPVNQAPEFTEPGRPGESLSVFLELKLIADVGLVGFPNAGKSTLLSRLSAARPKIADYPFTTLHPCLGIVALGEFRSFVMADIPGLIQGAHQGKGLGHSFLKHIERTRILLFLIDLSSSDIYRDFSVLYKELECFNSEMVKKPMLIVLNKLDLGDKKVIKKKFKKTVPILKISAVSGQCLPDLLKEISNLLK